MGSCIAVAGVIVRQVVFRARILFFGWFPVDVVRVAYPGLVLADGERPFLISVVLGNLSSLDPASPTTDSSSVTSWSRDPPSPNAADSRIPGLDPFQCGLQGALVSIWLQLAHEDASP